MVPVDLPVLLLRRPRRDLLLGVFTAHLFWGGVAFTQRSTASFGLYTEERLPLAPSALLVCPQESGAPPVIFVGFSASTAIHQFHMTEDCRLEGAGDIQAPFPITQLACSGFGNNPTHDILALSADGRRLALLPGSGEGPPVPALKLDQRAERFIVADFNNDGAVEVMLFGRTMAGVATVSIASGTGLKKGRLLFPGLSVSDMAATDLNGDGLTDVALCHWLSNRLLIRFGIGNGLFSDQAALDLPAEPDRLSITTIPRKQALRILVTLPGTRSVAHLIGYPTGEVAVREVIPLTHQPTGIAFASINNDNLPDMVCATEGGYRVLLGATTSAFQEAVAFGAGAETVSWTTDDVHGDGLADLVYVERPNRLAVLSNARTSLSETTPRRYATGASPSGVLLQDFDDDGYVDIAITNRGSASVSFFPNRGWGDFDGQHCIEVSRSPEYLCEAKPLTGATQILLAAHPGENSISVINLRPRGEKPYAVTVPTGTRPEILLAEQSTVSDRLRILLRYTDADNSRSPMALIERFSGKQLVEKGYRWPSHLGLEAITTGRVSGNPQGDIIMALRDRRSAGTSIAIAPPIDGFDYRRFVNLFTIPDSIGIPRFLISGRVNADTSTDIAVLLGEPMNALGIAFGSNDRRVLPPRRWIRGISPADRQSIRLLDANGDGAADLIYRDATDRTVKVLYGRRDGRFSNPVSVIGRTEVSSFAVGPLFAAGVNDLVTTDRQSHTFTIHRRVFR